ncbi:hypothetical protein HDU97_005721 [Phlyctochytrium planicorne]|nr:hypothetical protein HDU97_005721 [Phlyctochytrium planicorne]
MHLSALIFTIASLATAAVAQDAIVTEVTDPIPVYKNVKIGQICGSWISRDNGVAKYFQYECTGDSSCVKAESWFQVGTCVGFQSPTSAQSTTDGTCGVSLVSSPYSSVPSYTTTFCNNGDACVVAKGEINGTCQKKNGGSNSPAPIKDENILAELNQKCGYWLTPGKFNKAQCAAGLQCQLNSQYTGICQATGPLYYSKYTSTTSCGYSTYPGYYSVCANNDCVFYDKTSLSGFCKSGKPSNPTFPSTTGSFPTAFPTYSTGAPYTTDAPSTKPSFPTYTWTTPAQTYTAVSPTFSSNGSPYTTPAATYTAVFPTSVATYTAVFPTYGTETPIYSTYATYATYDPSTKSAQTYEVPSTTPATKTDAPYSSTSATATAVPPKARR